VEELLVCVSNCEFSRRIQDSGTLLGARGLAYARGHSVPRSRTSAPAHFTEEFKRGDVILVTGAATEVSPAGDGSLPGFRPSSHSFSVWGHMRRPALLPASQSWRSNVASVISVPTASCQVKADASWTAS
jgi:hypothetical protein